MTRNASTKAGTMLVLALAGAVTAGTPASATAGPLNLDVMATIKNFDEPQKIGTLKVDNGFLGHPSGMNGRFEFDAKFGFLNDHYDFDWVNICLDRKGTKAENLFKNVPAFDPQPSEKEDDLPFYYNAKEWGANKFSGEPIYKRGEFSQFIDFPKLPEGEWFEFAGFLVVRDRDKYEFHGDLHMEVLAGWTWRYDGDKNFDPPKVNGASKVHDELALDGFSMGYFGDAVDNNDAFKGWSAGYGNTLVPTPGSLALLALSAAAAIRRRRAP